MKPDSKKYLQPKLLPAPHLISLPKEHSRRGGFFKGTLSAVIFLGALLTVVAVVRAQEPPGSSPSTLPDTSVPTLPPVPVGVTPGNVYQLPSVYVRDVKIDEVKDNTLRGSFTVENRSTTLIDNLEYEVFLLGPPPQVEAGQLVADTGPLYDRQIIPDAISILPGAKKTRTFTYTAPRVPEGDYRIRIRLITAAGVELGWEDRPVRLGIPGETPFVLITAGSVQAENQDPVPPESGPSVAPQGAVTLNAQVRNVSNSELFAKPHITLYRYQPTRGQEREQSFAPVRLAPQQNELLTLKLAAPKTPESYLAVLTLLDTRGTVISSSFPFRFVVTGQSGRIGLASFEQLATKAGTQARVRISLVGAADQETPIEGRLVVSFLDGTETLATETLPVQLDATLKEVRATFTLPRDVSQPGLRAHLETKQGEILDTYGILPKLSEEELKNTSSRAPVGFPIITEDSLVTIWWVVAAAVLAIMTILFLSRRKRRRIPRNTVMLLILIAGGALFLSARSSRANGIHMWQTSYMPDRNAYRFSMFINAPQHGGVYDSSYVPINFDIRLWVCDNSPTSGYIQVWSGTQSGFFSYWGFPGEQFTGWQANIPNMMGSCGGAYDCWRWIGGYAGAFQAANIGQDTVAMIGRYYSSAWGHNAEDAWHLWIYHPFRPIGAQESTQCAEVRGWACDQNTPMSATTVQVTVDGQAVGTTAAGYPRSPTQTSYASQCGNTTNHDFRFTLPSSIRNGLPHSIATYGIDDKIGGIDAGNGLLTGAPQTIICPALLPDLSVADSEVRVNGQLIGGNTVSLLATVRNASPGATASAGASKARFEIDGTVVSNTVNTSTLNVNQSQNLSLSWLATTGNHRLRVCADLGTPANQVIESNELNNCGTSAEFSVIAPPTTPTPTPQPTIPGAGFKERPS